MEVTGSALCTEKAPWQPTIWEKSQSWVRPTAEQDRSEWPEKGESREHTPSQKSWVKTEPSRIERRASRQAVEGDRFIGEQRN